MREVLKEVENKNNQTQIWHKNYVARYIPQRRYETFPAYCEEKKEI